MDIDTFATFIDAGSISHVALCTSSTTQGGDMVAYGALSSSTSIQSGDAFEIEADDFTFGLD